MRERKCLHERLVFLQGHISSESEITEKKVTATTTVTTLLSTGYAVTSSPTCLLYNDHLLRFLVVVLTSTFSNKKPPTLLTYSAANLWDNLPHHLIIISSIYKSQIGLICPDF